MKRFVVLALVLLSVVGAALTATASTEGKLLIWADELRTTVVTDLAKEFTAKYKVPVEVQELGFGDIRDQLAVAAPAGKGPDIIVGAHDWLGQLVTNGLIAPIDFAKQKDFSPVALNAFTWGKNLYGVPYAIESIGLFYNKNLVPNPPKTWDELLTIGRKISDKANKKYGFVIPQPDPYHTFPMMSAAGGYVFGTNPDGTLNPLDVGLNNQGAVRGLELLVQLIKEGIMPTGIDYPTMMSLFKEGRMGMIVTGPWAIAEIREAKVNYGFTKIPMIDGKAPRPFVGVQGFMISSFSKNKMLAKAFLNDYIATEATMNALFNKDPRPTAHLALAAKITDPDIIGTFESANAGIPMPAIPEMASVWTAWSNALELIFNGKMTPQKALDEAVTQIIATIKGQ